MAKKICAKLSAPTTDLNSHGLSMRQRRSVLLGFLSAVLLLTGCGGTEPSCTGVGATSDSPAEKKTQPVGAHNEASESGAETELTAMPAPDFSLPNLSGDLISLSSHKGSIVVLEWFNPECPFVQLAYSRELSLKGMASEWSAKGVKWFGINSAAEGMQGHGAAVNQSGAEALGISNPILLDEAGKVGRAYNATNTPQIVVIDQSGNIVYNGAIDNTMGGDPEDAEPGPAVNLVTPVLTKLAANKTVPYQKTKPWGCSVKYAR